MGARTLVAWRFSDGKAGHDAQSLGLLEALGRRVPVDLLEVGMPPPPRRWFGVVPRPAGAVPDLLVGAGHATHLPLLLARHRFGGRGVVLMKPSLPRRWFDLCIVPEHDGVPAGGNVLPTRGVLNRVRADDRPREARGLVLVGGPSRLHDWDAAELTAQIAALSAAEPARAWTVTDSRRTPEGFLESLAPRLAGNVQVVPWAAAETGWLARQLVRVAVAWVSEDSVSMVYEALTGGAAVGLLAMPARAGTGRVLRGLDTLRAEGWVTTLEQWLAGGRMPAPRRGFNEAERCAQLLMERWWPDR
jgi:hypothetical protein